MEQPKGKRVSVAMGIAATQAYLPGDDERLLELLQGTLPQAAKAVGVPPPQRLGHACEAVDDECTQLSSTLTRSRVVVRERASDRSRDEYVGSGVACRAHIRTKARVVVG